MARWENEDVSDLNLPNATSTEEVFIGLNGEESTEEEAVAKLVKSSNGSSQFFIKYGRSELLDPHQTDSSYASARRHSHMYKFKKVSEKTFEVYKKYLTSKNRIYFTRARRFLMES